MAGGLGTAPDEDAWNLDDSDNEGGGPSHQDITQVAAQAGLGRKSSSNALNGGSNSVSLPAPAATTASSGASLSSLSSANGKSALSPVAAAAIASSAALPGNTATPRSGYKDRGRQSSFGFWERFTGGGGSSSNNSSSKEIDKLPAEMSGYSRFDDQLELEDNFDGTYSVKEGQGKLAPPANISRPPLLGGGIARMSAGKVPTSASLVSPTSASQGSKGKSRSLEVSSPGATIVGTMPRPKSPLSYARRAGKPRDDEDMRRCIRKDSEDVLAGTYSLSRAMYTVSEIFY